MFRNYRHNNPNPTPPTGRSSSARVQDSSQRSETAVFRRPCHKSAKRQGHLSNRGVAQASRPNGGSSTSHQRANRD
ncbi:hypothetical protein SMAC4_13254 [Sordaria macrospora]|uniref:uncharacterized protein n=1 Tax=Sordaria macrospora TaxID=5147 RepID=UPI002B2AEE96|nr:hypothetical protein SMAC4_13254 [Sordaria macrospora]